MRQPTVRQVTGWLKRIENEASPLFGKPALAPADVLKLAGTCFSIVRPTLKPSPAQCAAAVHALEHLGKGAATRRAVAASVMRLVANFNFIVEGMEIPLWDGKPTYTDMYVMGVGRLPETPGHLPGLLLMLKLKTGLCAGIIICGRLNSNQLSEFLLHSAGTAKFNCAPEEISGMEARGTVSLNPDGTLKIHSLTCSDAQKKHNRDLTERRGDPLKCGTPGTPCNACSRNIKECPLAVWLPKKEERK